MVHQHSAELEACFEGGLTLQCCGKVIPSYALLSVPAQRWHHGDSHPIHEPLLANGSNTEAKAGSAFRTSIYPGNPL